MSNWGDFYKGLLAEAKPDGNGCLQIKTSDIDSVFERSGHHHYVFGGFWNVYTSEPLTEEQQAEYEAKAQEQLSWCAEELSKEIDKEILKNMGYE